MQSMINILSHFRPAYAPASPGGAAASAAAGAVSGGDVSSEVSVHRENLASGRVSDANPNPADDMQCVSTGVFNHMNIVKFIWLNPRSSQRQTLKTLTMGTKKKRSPKKRTEKKAVGNADTKDKEDNEEDSKQKRKGWWSLKG